MSSLKKYVRPLFRHPQLLTKIPGGLMAVSISHASIEIQRARTLYAANAGHDLKEVVEKISSTACHDYEGNYLNAIVRETKPEVVVETGVASGVSSYAILQAMEDYGKGFLYSIDLPNATLAVPKGNAAGYLVPEGLRGRWKLLIGDSGSLLSPLLNQVGVIDMFIHDSLHTYEHMMYEYETAWPHLRRGGLLISDDIESSSAFHDFCSNHEVQGTVLERKRPGYMISFGWTKKP